MIVNNEQLTVNNERSAGVLAAVSGGADSVAMLHMLLGDGRDVVVAHYNHGLREEAGGDEAFVRGLCEKWGVPFVCERGKVPKGASVEALARDVRYRFLERVRLERGLDVVATAHTADDNAETVLLNLTRGSGLHGLCGIPPRRGCVIRPLLSISRAEVLQYLKEHGLTYCEDATNAETVYRRNFIRHKVIPALKELNPALTDSVTRLTQALREDEEYLTSLAAEEVERHGSAYPAKRLCSLPRPIAVRVCRALYAEKAQYPPEHIHIEAMLDIAAGGNGRRRCLAGNLTVEKQNGNVHINFTIRERGRKR